MERLNNEDRLSAYFDGELPSNERSEMEERLRSTPELRRKLDEFQMQRQWLAALPCPALSGDFTSRVMEQVLAAAVAPPVTLPSTATTITPPPFPSKTFPSKTKRRSTSTLIAAVLSTAAMVGIGYFVVNELNKPPIGGGHVATTGSDKPVANDPSVVTPQDELPESPVNSDPGTTIAANGDPEKKLPTNESPVANLPEENTPKENEPIVSLMPKESISKDSSPQSNSNARTATNIAAVYAAATVKTPPKAYRVQIGARSEFDARLKEAGVSVVASKVIDPPTHAPGVPSVNVLPDPEYVVVEGSESQLADLLEKLAAQTDLQLVESKNDLEASMLIDALCRMDSAKEPLRPSSAKEGEIAAFSFPVKALRPLIPSSLPTNDNPSMLPAGNTKGASPPKPYVPSKAPEKEGDALYVPRLIFILDVRVGEAERVPVK